MHQNNSCVVYSYRATLSLDHDHVSTKFSNAISGSNCCIFNETLSTCTYNLPEQQSSLISLHDSPQDFPWNTNFRAGCLVYTFQLAHMIYVIYFGTCTCVSKWLTISLSFSLLFFYFKSEPGKISNGLRTVIGTMSITGV